jgi:hypothetical protein
MGVEGKITANNKRNPFLVDNKDRENNTVQSHFHVLRNRNIMGFIKSTEGEDLEYENQ